MEYRTGKKRQGARAPPVRTFTGSGARVALQRCPILRAGSHHFSTKSNAKGAIFLISYSEAVKMALTLKRSKNFARI
jgi:hypothetical protein